MKFHIEKRGTQSEIWIPGATLAHIQQSASGFGEHIARVGESQFQLLSCFERCGKHDRDQVVTFSPELGSFQRLVLNEVNRVAIHPHRIDLQIARKFEHQGSLASLSNQYVKLGCCTQSRGRLHGGTDAEVGYANIGRDYAGRSSRMFHRRRTERGPHIPERNTVPHPDLARPQGFGDVCVPKQFEVRQLFALQVSMEETREFSRGFHSARGGKKMAEVHEKTESVGLRQITTDFTPRLCRLGALRK